MNQYFKYFVSLVILLHCAGITQLVSSYSKDKSAFIGMLNMSEEETKKEKEAKEDIDDSKQSKTRHCFYLVSLYTGDNGLYLSESKVRITDQFISDNVTPPPDFAG